MKREREPELDLNKAMENFRANPTIDNAFNVRSHVHPDIPGYENAEAYQLEVNAWIRNYLDNK